MIRHTFKNINLNLMVICQGNFCGMRAFSQRGSSFKMQFTLEILLKERSTKALFQSSLKACGSKYINTSVVVDSEFVIPEKLLITISKYQCRRR